LTISIHQSAAGVSGNFQSQLIAGVPFTVAPVASDPGALPQSLAFNLLSAPVGADINPTNGLVTWRPTMAQAGTSNLFTMIVTEAGCARISRHWLTHLFAMGLSQVPTFGRIQT